MQPPTPEQFWNNHGQDQSKPDVAFLKNHFYREGRLTEEQALWILEKATEVLRKEPNVLEVDAPITGQFVADACAMYNSLSLSSPSLWGYPRPICMLSHPLSDPRLLMRRLL